jgi:hypothetical protein
MNRPSAHDDPPYLDEGVIFRHLNRWYVEFIDGERVTLQSHPDVCRSRDENKRAEVLCYPPGSSPGAKFVRFL